MKAQVKNLKDAILDNDTKVMYCPVHKVPYSANKGDYWNYPEEHIFYCQDRLGRKICGKTMILGYSISNVLMQVVE